MTIDRPALNDKQISRMVFRIGLFKRRGQPERRADSLACRLATRDYERDDRYLCLECSSLQRGGTCFVASHGRMPGTDKRMQPVVDVLQRCPHFTFQTP